jgi:hypothetical protein
MDDPAPPRRDLYEADATVAGSLPIEQRLRDAGYAQLADVLRSGGDFEFVGDTVDEVVEEALRYLRHQQSVELAGATILAAIGEQAVKAQAFDAVLRLTRRGR